jgi:CRP-like cAMP-binding protein
MLEDYIQYITPLPEDILAELTNHFERVEYPKNHLLLRQGIYSTRIWFLAKGAVRYFHTDENGKDWTVWFSFENEFIADSTTLKTDSPTRENIQLLEDSELYFIDYKHIQALLEKHHAFALWYINILQHLYIPELEDRIIDLQFLNARQRYEKLLEQFPGISNRINLGYIASFLNITQETLSRIRAGTV